MKYLFKPSWLNDNAEEYDPPHIKRFTHNVEELLQKYTDDQCEVFTRMMQEAVVRRIKRCTFRQIIRCDFAA